MVQGREWLGSSLTSAAADTHEKYIWEESGRDQEGKGWSSAEAASRPAQRLCLGMAELWKKEGLKVESSVAQTWESNSWHLINFLVTAQPLHKTQTL